MNVNTSFCWCCGGDKISQVHAVREMMYGTREVFEYLECSNCGSIRIRYIPENLADYYPPNYYSFVSDMSEESDPSRARIFLRRQRSDYMMGNFNPIGWLVSKISQDYFPYPWSWFQDTKCTTSSHILDIGCGQGQLLRTMRMHGFMRLKGADPYVGEATFFPGLEIEKKALFQIHGQFDVVMSHHSFEHTSDPLLFLQKIKGLCKIGGHILIRMPVLNASWKVYGTSWYELDPPRHLWVPTINGLETLIERVGDLIIEKKYFDTKSPEFFRSEMYSRDIPMFDSWGKKTDPTMVFSIEEIEDFKRKATDYNKSDTAGRIVLIITRSK